MDSWTTEFRTAQVVLMSPLKVEILHRQQNSELLNSWQHNLTLNPKAAKFSYIIKSIFIHASFGCLNSVRNWTFATNKNFLIPISLISDGLHLWYFKLKLIKPTEFIVSKSTNLGFKLARIYELENQSLWQKLNSFMEIYRF